MNDTLPWSSQKSDKWLQLVVTSTGKSRQDGLKYLFLVSKRLDSEVPSCAIVNSVACWILVGKAMFRSRSKWTPSTSTTLSKHLYNLCLKREKKKETGKIPDFWVLHHPWNLTLAWYFVNLFLFFLLPFHTLNKFAAIMWWWGKLWKHRQLAICLAEMWSWGLIRVFLPPPRLTAVPGGVSSVPGWSASSTDGSGLCQRLVKRSDSDSLHFDSLKIARIEG